jgi:ParB family transcriptional regulator, chromosome partitioning protein
LMKVIDVPINQIHAGVWNPNQMDEVMHSRLRRSIQRFGLVVPLVIRPTGHASYETIGGAQRLAMLRELGIDPVPCVVANVDDANARLLAQALNRIQGQDDLGLQAELIREVLHSFPQEEVLQLLPETAQSLQALSALGQETMADYLKNWQQAQGARLKHLQFQLTPIQLEVVEETLTQILPQAKEEPGDSPNARGTALYLLCQVYLEQQRRIS